MIDEKLSHKVIVDIEDYLRVVFGKDVSFSLTVFPTEDDEMATWFTNDCPVAITDGLKEFIKSWDEGNCKSLDKLN